MDLGPLDPDTSAALATASAAAAAVAAAADGGSLDSVSSRPSDYRGSPC